MPHRTLNIYYDVYPDSPRSIFESVGRMVCFHNRLCLGDVHCIPRLSSWDKVERYLRDMCDAVVVLPIYIYEHSGVAMNTTGAFCPRGGGQIGFIYATEDDILDACCVTELSPEALEDVKKILVGEIAEYNAYFSGEVYHFILSGEDGTIIDECGGFYGDWGVEAILQETGFTGVEAK